MYMLFETPTPQHSITTKDNHVCLTHDICGTCLGRHNYIHLLFSQTTGATLSVELHLLWVDVFTIECIHETSMNEHTMVNRVRTRGREKGRGERRERVEKVKRGCFTGQVITCTVPYSAG